MKKVFLSVIIILFTITSCEKHNSRQDAVMDGFHTIDFGKVHNDGVDFILRNLNLSQKTKSVQPELPSCDEAVIYNQVIDLGAAYTAGIIANMGENDLASFQQLGGVAYLTDIYKSFVSYNFEDFVASDYISDSAYQYILDYLNLANSALSQNDFQSQLQSFSDSAATFTSSPVDSYVVSSIASLGQASYEYWLENYGNGGGTSSPEDELTIEAGRRKVLRADLKGGIFGVFFFLNSLTFGAIFGAGFAIISSVIELLCKKDEDGDCAIDPTSLLYMNAMNSNIQNNVYAILGINDTFLQTPIGQ